MNTTPSDSTGNPVLEAFIRAIRESFHDEPWEAIEPYAERVWIESRMDQDPDWQNIKERIRAHWPFPAAA